MSNALVTTTPPSTPALPAPWRDPFTVSPGELQRYIGQLEQACLENPRSADLRTCLGIAYAVNYDVYKSMDALEAATSIDPEHFWAQLKCGELYYRLRALDRAEEETLKAVDLAQTPWQLSLARGQLKEIRTLKHGAIRNVAWTKPLGMPTMVLSVMLLALFLAMTWR